MPTYANVPDVPGVPPIVRAPGVAPPQPPAPLTSDTVSLPSSPTPIWGIFDQHGNPVLTGRSVVAFEFQKEFQISDYPQEQGSFQSYNKVERPYDVRLRFAQDGTELQRQSFLSAVQAAASSLTLYTVITPTVYYPNANVVRYDYERRSDRGVTLLVVDIWIREVRVTATATLSNTQAPSGSDPQNNGTQQPVVPTPSNSSLAANPPTTGTPGDVGTAVGRLFGSPLPPLNSVQ